MQIKEFSFDLPSELIAQEPLANRSDSRLMVLDHGNRKLEHKRFTDIVDYLEPGDCLVVNNTKVLPARLLGERPHTHGKVEILLLQRLDADRWEVLAKPGKKAREGDRVLFGGGLLEAVVEEVKEDGNRIVRFSYEGIFEQVLDRLGEMPLPPYIQKRLEDKERYQTVYAKHEGSAAAPTAGLHFTRELLEEVEAKGVEVAHVTLHVGLGTFRPVKVQNVLEHEMHAEMYRVDQEAADKINRCKRQGHRLVAVGTTSARTLESVADKDGLVEAKSGWTDIFIYPGYRFKTVDALVTNFHLPESSLMLLVSALAGRDFIMEAYQEAIRQRYRFFSFGDAMLIHDFERKAATSACAQGED
ncbi:tRNA preQ1(34) S-adenosylmethionine ribosyltransferase-isomerase QueA [Anaerotalea alkaliphila]|uniref:S-adenosylmethionine:tRNA ribosyltransferase-isomerase n=1 Tax=Anaerotalea alkaliphila TaxID=2662126 RepID=A0A7X5KNU3_9FIRM|nr:tRNA preQ1(34) S-adenosylmethionine ribosyltransferase-isomerase QueA [Anaerotalea alkaliphila]NDL67097.1 tRNA preQ1(34) S-adenosylmethionine ribosyltransferase-isomerase QueA [Anaerotalea alkaliphila]